MIASTSRAVRNQRNAPDVATRYWALKVCAITLYNTCTCSVTIITHVHLQVLGKNALSLCFYLHAYSAIHPLGLTPWLVFLFCDDIDQTVYTAMDKLLLVYSGAVCQVIKVSPRSSCDDGACEFVQLSNWHGGHCTFQCSLQTGTEDISLTLTFLLYK